MHNQELAARHFTTSAIHIIEQLWPRAADRGIIGDVSEETVPTLALWALLRWERKLGLVALEETGVKVEELAREVGHTLDVACEETRKKQGPPKVQALPSGQRAIVIDLRTPLTPLLSTAEHEALALNHNWVGSEHLLLAIIRLAEPSLREVLDRHEVEYEKVKKAVRELLQPNHGDGKPNA